MLQVASGSTLKSQSEAWLVQTNGLCRHGNKKPPKAVSPSCLDNYRVTGLTAMLAASPIPEGMFRKISAAKVSTDNHEICAAGGASVLSARRFTKLKKKESNGHVITL